MRPSRPVRWLAQVAWLAIAGMLAGIAPAEARRVHRSIFYAETPFGSLAWVDDATTRAAARSRFTIEDLTTESCMSLPSTGAQWFIVNHRDDDLDGQAGYFSVRVLYKFASSEVSADTRTGIHLQRNANWFDASGRQVAQDFERGSEQIALTEEAFIELHTPAPGQEELKLAELSSTIGNWHMKPAKDAESSWSDRYLYGPMLRAYLGGVYGAISARLIRFTATASSNSSEPVLFWLEPRGATSATILIDAPRHSYGGSRRVYSLVFGGTCDD